MASPNPPPQPSIRPNPPPQQPSPRFEGTPMAPPSAAPQWVVLRRSPGTSMDMPEGADITLALAAPPRPSDLLVPPSLRGCAILAADPSAGFLLLSSSCGTDPLAAAAEPAGASYHLCDTTFKAIKHIPVPDTPVNDDTAGVAGLAIGERDIMIAELSIRDSAVTLRCFPMETSTWTTHRNLRSPPALIKHQWRSAYSVSYRGRLWWVDLLQGLVACDPFADTPELHFVPLPRRIRCRGAAASREDLSKDRCVSLSCEKLRLVVINNRCTSQTRIALWTLADYEAGKWSLDFDVHIQDIWGHESYRTTGLSMERPVLAFVHPTNAHVVYFFLQQQLFAVDLQTAKVTESESSGRDDEHFLAWELPPSLRTRTSGPSLTQESIFTSAFDNVADSFCETFGLVLADMEFRRLSRIALAYLNRKKKPQDMYKFSERLFLQIFEEDNNITIKKYAHINFYVDTGSKKVLVFAEFHSNAICDEDRDEWTLSACKTLTRSYHGGLYGENADERRRKGAKKRKRSTYCFVCSPEILHPISGFEGGYPGVSPM